MIKTQGRIECPTCLGGTNPDYALNPCPHCWGALKVPQLSSPFRAVVGRFYQKLLTALTKRTDSTRNSPDGDQKR